MVIYYVARNGQGVGKTHRTRPTTICVCISLEDVLASVDMMVDGNYIAFANVCAHPELHYAAVELVSRPSRRAPDFVLF